MGRCEAVATAALDLIASLGGKVEGYPEGAGSVPAGFLFNGALSTYEKLGFVRDRKIGKHHCNPNLREDAGRMLGGPPSPLKADDPPPSRSGLQRPKPNNRRTCSGGAVFRPKPLP